MVNFDLLWIAICFNYIWFETDAFWEYANLFGLKFTKAHERIGAFKAMSYHNFLLTRYDNFFTRLITCPICVSVWINFILYTTIGANLLDLSPQIILTWIGSAALKKVLYKLNE